MRVGSRTSALAIWQADQVLAGLRRSDPEGTYTFVGVRTAGDGSLRPLYEEGGEGVFTGALEEALIRGSLDLAVHSLKDVPLSLGRGLGLGAVLKRGNPCDAMVGRALKDLGPGARVGTSSPRRAAALRAFRPDLVIVPVRGNVPRRLGLVDRGEVDAVILAAAGLERLGLSGHVTELLSLERFPPAPGQGVVAIEGRVDDMPPALEELNDRATQRATEAERSLLARLGGGCGLPLGAYAEVLADGGMSLYAQALSLDGTQRAVAEASATAQEALVDAVYQQLVDQGVETWWKTAD